MMALPRPNALSWLGLSAVLIGLDQWSKHWALSNLVYQQPVPVIDGWAWWTLVYNYGAAFSLLADAGGWQRWFFTGLAVVISVALVFWLARTPRGDWRTALPFALVIAGAVGNLVDRLRFGYVVDFIDVLYWPGRHWPAFNIADSCIVVGAILLVLFSFKAPAAAGNAG
ncbi:MAG: signal peptidase II [Arenimonas sp.]|nr:signal peptidase II [Arenimonas sp.]